MFFQAGADFHKLLTIFQTDLEKDLVDENGELINPRRSLRNVFASMFLSRNIAIPHYLTFSELEDAPVLDTQVAQRQLNPGQQYFVDSVLNILQAHSEDSNAPYLMFLQGRAGTGKTYTTNTLINQLRTNSKKVLVSGSTGIAASQYHGGQTVHSLFALSIDQKYSNSEFKCNIGKKTNKASSGT